MRRIWEKSSGYSFWRHYVDFCTRASFSSVEIDGLDNMPREGAVLLAPNHRAALMDPLLVLLLREGPTGFGARADIFRRRRIASILRWLRILPLARERDGLHEVAKNWETFEEIIDCLGHGVPFCLFSEGTHRAERGMMPVKKGLFRIARMACDELEGPVSVVPVGIDYDYFFRQGGRAAIRIGKAIDMREAFSSGKQEADIYHELCTELRERDLALTDRLPERGHGKIALRLPAALPLLPLYPVFALASAPIWLPARIILARFEDKAWSHTVYYACRLLLPVFLPFYYIFSFIHNFLTDLIGDMKTVLK